MRTKHSAAISVRLRFADDARLGPGKIALLEAVERTGSIAAAGRDMSMSYRRAWLLIDSLNRMFDEPVVRASPGGPNGGGASLSALGRELVAAYRAMEADTMRAVERHFDGLRARMIVADGAAGTPVASVAPDDPDALGPSAARGSFDAADDADSPDSTRPPPD